jgi:general stress protein 26
MSHDEDVAKVTELVKDMRMGMLTTVDVDGSLVSRPMAAQETEFDGDLWFYADGDSSLVGQLETKPQVNVSFSSSSSWVSIAGSAEVVRDPAKAKELWNSWVEAWFPDGPETPGRVLGHAGRPDRLGDQLRQVQDHRRALRRWREQGRRPALIVPCVPN